MKPSNAGKVRVERPVRAIGEFERGVLYAAGILALLHDQPGMAATIVHEAGLENANLTGMDDFDQKNLRLLTKERGINFKFSEP